MKQLSLSKFAREKRLNELEIRLIFLCRHPTQASEVYRRLVLMGIERSENWIFRKLRELANRGYLIRRRIAKGHYGNRSYYTATPEALGKALLEAERLRKGSDTTTANLRQFTTRMG